MEYKRLATIKSAAELRAYAETSGLSLPIDDATAAGKDAPLAKPLSVGGRTAGNRFCALPMEGWDAEPDGRPSELVKRRWMRFGASGAKLLWMEATAVMPEVRANPHQLIIDEKTVGEIAAMRAAMVDEHRRLFGTTDDLLVGLQLTHSGRFSRPVAGGGKNALIAYHHPVLDKMFGLGDDYPVLTDSDLRVTIDAFVRAAALAQKAGFDFVDVKHCHGYLGHELLSAFTRPGEFGGSFENRTRFLREAVSGIRSAAAEIAIAVRLSAFDFVPFRKGADGVGVPAASSPYHCAFGGDGTGLGIDLAEPLAFLDLCDSLGINLICVTGGSPYYTPHIQRPATFPPSDGYLPPEDPLAGVCRQIHMAAELKRRRPRMTIIGSAYSYLQEWLPNVAQAVVRTGMADGVGVGRGLLSYPGIVADVLAGRPLDRKRICRTFSDCTTAPRHGMVSGCYPLDECYQSRPECARLAEIKRGIKK